MAINKKIVLVTTKQPSSNPRLVKEATALAAEGYDVTVIYNFWSLWAEKADELILNYNKKINWIRAGSHPIQNKSLYWYSRVRYKCFRILASWLHSNLKLQENAAAQFFPELKKETVRLKADLYIAHNLGALAAAAAAATSNKARYAFDAEDFHREQEETNHKAINSISLIESYYFPGAAFVTAASPLIATEYKKTYPLKEFVVINNVFSKLQQPAFQYPAKNPFKLFWFSQTVGQKRGLQDIIHAINRIKSFPIAFTILGDADGITKQALQSLLYNTTHNLLFHPPCNEVQLINLSSQHHVGLALEPGFSLNNNIALSNKLFTYLLAGNAVILSATPAQKMFFEQYPSIGWLYSSGDIDSLVQIIDEAYHNETLLNNKRQAAYELANTSLNWESEKTRFLSLVKQTV